MKKILYFVVIALITLVSCNDYDERLDALENSTIKTINEQINAINATILNLNDIDSNLNDSINSSATRLSNCIAALKKYMESELSNNKDWCNATFSTLEQHDSIVQVLCDIKETMSTGDLKLSNKIDSCIKSTRNWVSESLAGYYDIATADAKMASLDSRMMMADSITNKNINNLKEQLDSAKSQLTASYKKAISDAIETNNGIIEGKIAKEVNAINKRIDEEISSINLKLAALEGRIEALEDAVKQLSKKLDITFSDNEISCSPGDILNINYRISNSNGHASVYTMGNNGWNARVNKQTDSTGVIVVTAPNPISSGSILIFVNEDNKSVIKSLNFIKGSMSVSEEAVMADADGGTVSVNIDTDLQYNVVIPQNVNWVHFNKISTRSAMRQETATFNIDENVSSVPRIAVIELKNNNNLTIGSVTIRQNANIQQANEIWYTSTTGSVVTPYNENAFGANIVSNIYGKNKGIISFDSDVKKIGYQAFYNKDDLKGISIPNKASYIDKDAFYSCQNFVKVDIPNSVKTISSSAFFYCSKLVSIDIPNSVTNIGNDVFTGCSNLLSINIPNSVTSIGTSAFSSCSNLISIVIPNSITSISSHTFFMCNKLKSINIPNSVTSIGTSAFSGCNNLESIVIPNSVQTIETETFYGCTKLKSVIIGSSVNLIRSSVFYGCSSLKEIFTKSYPFLMNSDAFNTIDLSELSLYVPFGTKKLYEESDIWKDFGNIIEVDSIVPLQPEAVDLGLSVKWASFNVGAQSPEEYGSYFAWGETKFKSDYSFNTYSYLAGGYGAGTTEPEYDEYSIGGSKYKKLKPEYDAAHVFLGGNWRMPTHQELQDLKDNCTWTWDASKCGYKVKGTNGNSIFMPAADCQSGKYQYIKNGTNGNYWSATTVNNPGSTLYNDLIFSSYKVEWANFYNISNRCQGWSIRPVTE